MMPALVLLLAGVAPVATADLDLARSRKARVPLVDVPGWSELPAEVRQGHPDAPNWYRSFGAQSNAARPFAELLHAAVYRGALRSELKAALGLRIAQVNASPYVAAHMARALRGSEEGRRILEGTVPEDAATALAYAEALTRSVHGVSAADFRKARADFDDSQIVELTLVVAFFNYFTRYAEALNLPLESWIQVSLAVSLANGCRYCTLHQILGQRRLGVDPARLVALRKDDGALTVRERVAVSFARKLTVQAAGLTDADYAALRAEFGETGALEVVQQTCNFAFMNRFTDGLELPSEDEAVRVYHEVYGGGFGEETNR